ncbi:MAG: hypothetical protein AB7F89_06920 [Pirellulaceae bacterium]
MSGAGVSGNRRQFLGSCLGAAVAASQSGIGFGEQVTASRQDLPRIAAINSIYRLRSHAYHIAGRFLFGYRRNGFHHQPPFRLARMYNHQYPPDDLSRSVCPRHGVELCDTIPQALGGDRGLDVDGVLLIVEHGDYPTNDRGQILYPRFELFQQIVQFFEKAGRSVPVFCDKHLSYDHERAWEMVTTARRLGFRMLAGSSLPVTWRRPEIEPPLGTPFREGLVVFGYDRSVPEVYFFHALETLQCMLERRVGGETGVRSVRFLEGDAVWRAGDAGEWSWSLLHAALDRCPSKNYGEPREQVLRPQAILLEYRDGTRGAALNLVEAVSDFGFAAQVEGQPQPVSTCFYLPSPPGANFFNPLTYNIEHFFAGAQPYPVERTLLTSTVLDLALRAHQDQRPVAESPRLDIQYRPPADSGFFRGPMTDA